MRRGEVGGDEIRKEVLVRREKWIIEHHHRFRHRRHRRAIAHQFEMMTRIEGRRHIGRQERGELRMGIVKGRQIKRRKSKIGMYAHRPIDMVRMIEWIEGPMIIPARRWWEVKIIATFMKIFMRMRARAGEIFWLFDMGKNGGTCGADRDRSDLRKLRCRRRGGESGRLKRRRENIHWRPIACRRGGDDRTIGDRFAIAHVSRGNRR